MRRYYSTFITGFSETVSSSIKAIIPDIKIDFLDDGLIIYKTKSNLKVLKNIKFLNNTFALLKFYPKTTSDPVRAIIKDTIKDDNVIDNIAGVLPNRKVRFRIMATNENRFVAIDKKLRCKLENKILKIRSLILDRSNPEIEITITIRRNNYGILGLRLTRHSSYEKTLNRGEIYPELANILCLLSEPKKSDVVLDPFCGSGSIPRARAKILPSKKIYASDIDSTQIKITKEKVKNMGGNIFVSRSDALDLKSLGGNSVSKIITDPPWGIYFGKNTNLKKFYMDMLYEFKRITKKNGIIVIIIAKKDIFEDRLNLFKKSFELVKKYDTLVSGQKTRVYKIKRL